MHVATKFNKFDRDDLVALACRIHRDFPNEPDLFVRIFDNKNAAKKYEGPGQQHKSQHWEPYAKAFRAFYGWKPDAKEHWVTWNFDPLVQTSKSSTSEDLCLSK